MDDDTKIKFTENTKSLLENTKFKDVFLSAIPELNPSKQRRRVMYFLSVVIYLICTFLLLQNNIIPKIIVCFELMNNVFLPLFGIALTGYAIFQAIANGSTLTILILKDEGNKSMFLKFNNYFFILSIFYLSVILFNLLILTALKNIDPNIYIPIFLNKINTQICIILITLYFTVTFNLLIEFKSFIYNLYQCFNINATAKAIEYLKEEHRSN